MEHCKPLPTGRRRSDDVGGSQHVMEGEKDNFVRYQCERSKLDCNGARYCAFNEKADGMAVNSLEIIAAKIQDMKAERQRKIDGGAVSGSTYVIQWHVVPA